MGLLEWTINQMLTPKFWKSISSVGYVRTKQRAGKANRNTQYLGGHEDLVKCKGQDEFGNRYYEDFTVDRFIIR